MRVTRDERGAVAVVVAICGIMIFGFAAYAIDSGRLWSDRRHLITAADASALGSANDYAIGGSGCQTAAGSLVAANHSGATVTSCLPVVQGTSGHVTVAARSRVDFTFARIFGSTTKAINASTTAEWGIPTGANNLRPLGLCHTANAQLLSWLNYPAGPTGNSGVIRITYGKAQPLSCGTVPGNWGIQDFDGGSNSNQDTKQWTLNGYPGLVGIGGNIPGDTGAFSNSLDGELAFLKNSGEAFALPVFDTATGSGSNARFHIIAFVFVKLVDYRTTGPQANRYLDLIFTKGVISGTCCAPGGVNTLVRTLRICDVNTLIPNTNDPRAC